MEPPPSPPVAMGTILAATAAAGAAAGAARRVVCIPRVAAGTKEFRFGYSQKPEFRSIGLADYYRAGFPEANDHFTVMFRDVMPERLASGRHGHSGICVMKVFNEQRHSGESPFRKRVRGFPTAQIVHSRHNGIELRIDPLNPFDSLLAQFRMGVTFFCLTSSASPIASYRSNSGKPPMISS